MNARKNTTASATDYTFMYMETVNYIRPMSVVPSNYRHVFTTSEIDTFHANNIKASKSKRVKRRASEKEVTTKKSFTYERKEGSAEMLNGEYVMESMTILTARALKTVYQRSGNPFILSLINSIPVSIRRRNGELWLDHESESDDGEPMELMTSERRARNVGGIKILSKEREPDLTDWGRKTSATIQASARLETMTTFDDLVSVGVVKVYELASAGLVKCDRDIFESENKRAIFKAINATIYGERKTEKATRKNTLVNQDGNEISIFDRVESDPGYTPANLWDECVSFVEHTKGAKGDKLDIQACFGKAIGMNETEIGRKVGVTQQAISKRIKAMRKGYTTRRDISDARASMRRARDERENQQ